MSRRLASHHRPRWYAPLTPKRATSPLPYTKAAAVPRGLTATPTTTAAAGRATQKQTRWSHPRSSGLGTATGPATADPGSRSAPTRSEDIIPTLPIPTPRHPTRDLCALPCAYGRKPHTDLVTGGPGGQAL